MPDNTVEVHAEGDKQKLEQLVTLLKKGPVLARVDDIAVAWQEPTGRFEGFSIRY